MRNGPRKNPLNLGANPDQDVAPVILKERDCLALASSYGVYGHNAAYTP